MEVLTFMNLVLALIGQLQKMLLLLSGQYQLVLSVARGWSMADS